MTRNTAREIAAHLSYELSFTDKTVEELLQERLTNEAFAGFRRLVFFGDLHRFVDGGAIGNVLHIEDLVYITRLVTGVNEHAAELDGYIAKYAKNWKFSLRDSVAVCHR